MRSKRRTLAIAAVVWGCLVASAIEASDTCREWWREHENWKARVVALYLSDASQRELDTAMFEVVQFEAYLTACEGPVPGQRARLVSHRTIARPVDEYAATVPEALLEQAGFDLSLDGLFLPGERAGEISGAFAPTARPRARR